MRVVFMDNIKGVGQVGDVKDVADGYARNFLMPRGLAKPATDAVLRDIEAIRAKKAAVLERHRSEAEALAARLSGVTVTIAGKANEQGTLFAAIEAADVAAAITKQAGVAVSAEQVKLPEHLKTVGDHPLTLELAEGVSAAITLKISAQ
jgi:large subunit ribosomal protein L9